MPSWETAAYACILLELTPLSTALQTAKRGEDVVSKIKAAAFPTEVTHGEGVWVHQARGGDRAVGVGRDALHARRRGRGHELIDRTPSFMFRKSASKEFIRHCSSGGSRCVTAPLLNEAQSDVC